MPSSGFTIPEQIVTGTTVSGEVTLAQLTTTSGDIVAQIGESGVTLEQLTTTSGDIIAQIPSLAGYATELQLTTTSGDLVAQMGVGNVTEQQLTTTSGDIIAQIPSLSGYATQSWANDQFVTPGTLNTTSGNIVAQIPSLAGYATQDWANGQFTTPGMVNTVSGNIVSQIPSLAPYATTAQLTTTSGDIITQIPVKASGAEVNTGTVDTKFVTPKAVADSDLGVRYLNYTIDGAGAVISAGLKGYFRWPFAGTISSWTMIADVSGTIKINIWKHATGAVPTVSDLISSTTGPSLSNAQTVFDSTTFTNWTTQTVAAGDIFGFAVDAQSTTITRVNMTLKITGV